MRVRASLLPVHRCLSRNLFEEKRKRNFWSKAVTLASGRNKDRFLTQDLQRAVDIVRKHDPAGFLPGLLLREKEMVVGYFAVRSFWIETGLRMGNTAKTPETATAEEHLDWWTDGVISALGLGPRNSPYLDHPTLRLLHSLYVDNEKWDEQHFQDIIESRRLDLTTTQYESLSELTSHAEQSCGSLLRLVLESGGITKDSAENTYKAAELVGRTHGLTNSLRFSIPIVSTTGRLIIPSELTTKYGIRSPRYLLSALSQGDTKCLAAMQQAVQEIVAEARLNLEEARKLRPTILQEDARAMNVFLPGLASSTFLNRLEAHEFELTNRDLRNVGIVEHCNCAISMMAASFQNTY